MHTQTHTYVATHTRTRTCSESCPFVLFQFASLTFSILENIPISLSPSRTNVMANEYIEFSYWIQTLVQLNSAKCSSLKIGNKFVMHIYCVTLHSICQSFPISFSLCFSLKFWNITEKLCKMFAISRDSFVSNRSN